MAGQYWYPHINNDGLIHDLSSWGISISSQQLVKPTPDFVMNTYIACVQKVTGLTEDTIRDPLDVAIASLDEPNTVSPP